MGLTAVGVLVLFVATVTGAVLRSGDRELAGIRNRLVTHDRPLAAWDARVDDRVDASVRSIDATLAGDRRLVLSVVAPLAAVGLVLVVAGLLAG